MSRLYLVEEKGCGVMKQYQIDSGIARKRIVAYLESELGIMPKADGTYQLPGCAITLKSSASANTVLHIPRTIVIFSGEEEACLLQQKNFRMRFLSAGG